MPRLPLVRMSSIAELSVKSNCASFCIVSVRDLNGLDKEREKSRESVTLSKVITLNGALKTLLKGADQEDIPCSCPGLCLEGFF